MTKSLSERATPKYSALAPGPTNFDPFTAKTPPEKQAQMPVSRWQPPEFKSTKRASTETVLSAAKFLRREGVEHLPPEHPDRRKALLEWGKWFRRQPHDAYKNMAARDPNRFSKPKGWS